MKKLQYIVFILLVLFMNISFSSEVTPIKQTHKDVITTNSDKVLITPDFLLNAQYIIMFTILSGLIVTLYVARRTSKESINIFTRTVEHQTDLSKMEVLSKNRQDWINTLRNELSKFIGAIVYLRNNRLQIEGSAEEQVLQEQTKLMIETKVKILLLLNPTETKHQQLSRLMDELITNMKNVESTNSNYIKFTKLSQSILKDEWERVKRYE